MCYRRKLNTFSSLKKCQLLIDNSVPSNTWTNLCIFLGKIINSDFSYKPAVIWEREAEISCLCTECQRHLWQQAIVRRLNKTSIVTCFVHTTGERLILKLVGHYAPWGIGVKFTWIKVALVSSHTQQSWLRKKIRL